MIGQKFATPKIDYWCAPPSNTSFQEWDASKWRAFSSPQTNIEGSDGAPDYDGCRVYDVEYDNQLFEVVNGGRYQIQ